MAYVVIPRKKVVRSKESRVTFSKVAWHLTAAAFRAMGEPERVKFAYDPESNAVAIVPSTDLSAYRVNYTNGSYIISSRTFCKEFVPVFGERRVWRAIWNGAMLELVN